jgi:hypothetical protein
VRRARRLIFTVCHAVKLTLVFFVATALWAVDQSMEVPFFGRLDEHFFALQTIFGVLDSPEKALRRYEALLRDFMVENKTPLGTSPLLLLRRPAGGFSCATRSRRRSPSLLSPNGRWDQLCSTASSCLITQLLIASKCRMSR